MDLFRCEGREMIRQTDDALQKMQGFYTILAGCFQAGLHQLLCSLVWSASASLFNSWKDRNMELWNVLDG